MLKISYKTKEEIPQGAEGFYSEQTDGTWKLKIEGDVKTQEDVDRAMAAMEKQKNLRIEAEKELAKFKDVDLDKWEKVKDIDPDTPPTGDPNPDTEKEIQKRVAAQVREKEKELEGKYEKQYNQKVEEVNERDRQRDKFFKENWLKQMMAEKFGFTDPKRVRWFLLDIEAGQYPEIKKKLDSIDLTYENGNPVIVGGDLKDQKGAIEVLENITQSDVSKDYKPAKDNSGGGAGGSGQGDGGPSNNPFKKDEHGNYNRTAAGLAMRQDKEGAKQLAKQAGWSAQDIESLFN